MLDHRQRAGPRAQDGQRQARRDVRVGRAERGAVEQVQREADRGPRRAAGHRLAEQHLVGVVHAEGAHVELRLGRPRSRGDGSGEGSAGCPCAIYRHRPNCNRGHQWRVSKAWIARPSSIVRAGAASTRSSTGWPARCCSRSSTCTSASAASGASTSRPRARSSSPPTTARSSIPFVIGMMARRPLYFVAEEGAVHQPAGGAGCSPRSAPSRSIAAPPTRRRWRTARAILERGDGVLIFPEGTRIRPGPLGRPKRGVGRLALETGAPVVPVPIIGSEAVRSGWRIRPHKVRIRAGRAADLPEGARAQPPPRRRGHRSHLALRRAAVGVAGRHPAACAAPRSSAPARGAPASRSRSRAPAWRSSSARAPASRPRARLAALPDAICRLAPPRRATIADSSPPRPRLPRRAAARAAGGRRRRTARASPRAPACSCAPRASSPPLGTLPCAYVAERTRARAVACLGGPGARRRRARATAPRSSSPRPSQAFAAQLADVLRAARLRGAAHDRRHRRRARRRRQERRRRSPPRPPRRAGANAAGAAAGKVFAEVDATRAAAAPPETFAGSPARRPRRDRRRRGQPQPPRRRAAGRRRRRRPRRPAAEGSTVAAARERRASRASRAVARPGRGRRRPRRARAVGRGAITRPTGRTRSRRAA